LDWKKNKQTKTYQADVGLEEKQSSKNSTTLHTSHTPQDYTIQDERRQDKPKQDKDKIRPRQDQTKQQATSSWVALT
jgi:hypothetical protein